MTMPSSDGAHESASMTTFSTEALNVPVGCGARRVDVVEHASAAPRPLSAVIGGVSGR